MVQKLFKKLDKSVRKQMIIDTAVELFHEQGYRETTIDNIARRLGITKGAVYNYINSKEEILFIIYTQVIQKAFEDINQIKNTELSPDAKLKLIIRNHITNIIIRKLPLVFVFFSEENKLQKKYNRIVRKKKSEYNHIIEEIISEGISMGIFEDGDPRLLSYAILGMCNWIHKWYHSKIPFSPDKIADEFVEIIERTYLRTNRKIPPNTSLYEMGRKADLISDLAEKWTKQYQAMMDLLQELRNASEVKHEHGTCRGPEVYGKRKKRKGEKRRSNLSSQDSTD